MTRQLFFFACAGVVGLIVDVAVLYALQGIFGPFYGRAVSFLAAVLSTWLVNRLLTFSARHSGLSRRREFAVYLSLMLAGGAVNYMVYLVLVMKFPLVRDYLFLGVAAGSIAGMSVNFLTSRFVLFRRERG